MIVRHTVTAVTTTTTRSDDGDTSATVLSVEVVDVLYAPEGIAEAADRPVVGDASLYGAFPLLDADDTVTHATACGCGGTEFPFATWQVVGGAKGWAPGQVVVPIKRTSAA